MRAKGQRPASVGHTQAECHPELPMKKVTRRALRGHFHSPVVPAGHGNLRRIRDPSARGDEVRILRLRSQARFAQDDTALRERGRPGPKAAGVAKREASYGQKSGPKAGSRASSPGEQAAACDYIKTRELACSTRELDSCCGEIPVG